jgi:hypothetical protein
MQRGAVFLDKVEHFAHGVIVMAVDRLGKNISRT